MESKYLKLLKQKYPTIPSIYKELIHLNAVVNLPKGTEHFMSDLHGEYEAFYHILNSCSGVIKEKVKLLFNELSPVERQEICTLIYYPKEKLKLLHDEGKCSKDWYMMILSQLVLLAKLLSSKYPRDRVRKALPKDYAYIIDELLHSQEDEDDNRATYHQKILDTIIELDGADDFIKALATLIKYLAVDHLHIVGDIFDRGAYADKILDLLMTYHSLDIEWGNHDILWMGAHCGNPCNICQAILNNIKYDNTEVLERAYGISLRPLFLYAQSLYPDRDPMDAAVTEIGIMMFKMEGKIIKRHPEYEMDDRLLLDKMNLEEGTITINEIAYPLKETNFPTLDPKDPYKLTSEEKDIIDELIVSFKESPRLHEHISFLYEKGSMYKVYNDNLLFHGCIPLDEHGQLNGVVINGRVYKGKHFMDHCERAARRAFYAPKKRYIDFMWFLWAGRKSPLTGRHLKTFERTFVADEKAWHESRDPYYTFYEEEYICKMILREFGLYGDVSHIINGHTPVRTLKGESPVRANGKLLVIDGGFCERYHETTGIAGYTLIYNSHGLRLKAHKPFLSINEALRRNVDIESDSWYVETEKRRMMIKDTDQGEDMKEKIKDLKELLEIYRIEGTV